MARLPIPGADNGTWGSILNDYLQQIHHDDGTLKDNVVDSAALAPNAVQVDNLITSGGTDGQVLTKDSSQAGGMAWRPAPGGGSAVTSVNSRTGAVVLSATDVGLGNVNNTSDANKPISTAVQQALDAKLAVTDPRLTDQRTPVDGSVTLAKLAAGGAPTSGQVLSYTGSGLGWVTPSAGSTVSDATTTSKGIVQLAGDLAGTAAAPTVPGLAQKADKSDTYTKSEVDNGFIRSADRGVANGVAALGADGKVPAAQLPTAAGQVSADWNATSGVAQILNKPTIPTSLGDLGNVNPVAPTDGQVLTYDSATSRWIPKAVPSGSGGGNVSDATTTSKGIVQLAGDLGGTADAPTVLGRVRDYNWVPVQTADYIASKFDAIPVQTTGSDITVRLPASPAEGDRVLIERRMYSSSHRGAAMTVRIADSAGAHLAFIFPLTRITMEYRGGAWMEFDEGQGIETYIPTAQQATDEDIAPKFLQYKRSMWDYPQPSRMIADYASHTTSTISGTATVTTAAGSASVRGSSTYAAISGGQNFTIMKTLTAPINLVANVLRFYANWSTTGNSAATYMSIQVSSTGEFASGNYARSDLNTTHQLGPVWTWFGTAQYQQVGGGADLSAITAVRILASTTNPNTAAFYLDSAWIYPNEMQKAAVVLTFDDSSQDHVRIIAPKMAEYGFRGTLYCNIGEGGGALPRQLRNLHMLYGWEIAHHGFNSTDHNSPKSGVGLRQDWERSGQMARALGLPGHMNLAFYSGSGPSSSIPMNQDTFNAVQQRFLTARHFANGAPNITNILPPINPYGLLFYGYGSPDVNDATAMKAYIDTLIAGKLFGGISFHLTTLSTGFLDLLDYLYQKQNEGLLEVNTVHNFVNRYTK